MTDKIKKDQQAPRKHNYPKNRKPTGPRKMAGAKAKVKNRVDVSIGLAEADRDELKARHGSEWQDVVRQLIAAHLGLFR